MPGKVVFNRVPIIVDGIARVIQDVALATAAAIAEDAAASMEGGGSGRFYGKHQASSPGDPPAIDSGLLHGSIRSARLGSATLGKEIGAIAYTNVDYAPHLEFGTVRMEPRPFLGPAAERARPAFEAAVHSAIRRAVTR